MAKRDVNPVDQQRKAERKKEAAKNKRAREAARAAVAASKDPEELLAELNRVKKAPPPSHMGKEAAQAHTARVSRLEKEYAICVERHAEREAAARSRPKLEIDMTSITGGAGGDSHTAAVSKPRLERPREDSVYFHPVNNPWARPPPGMPQRWVDGSVGGAVIGDPEAASSSDDDSDDDSEEEGSDDAEGEAAKPAPLLPTPAASGALLPTPVSGGMSGMKRGRDDVPPPPPPPPPRHAPASLLPPPPPPPPPHAPVAPAEMTMPAGVPEQPTGEAAAAYVAWMQMYAYAAMMSQMAQAAATTAAVAVSAPAVVHHPMSAPRPAMKRPRMELADSLDPLGIQDPESAAIEARLNALRGSMVTDVAPRPTLSAAPVAAAPVAPRPLAPTLPQAAPAAPAVTAPVAPAIKKSVVAMRPTHVKARPAGETAPPPLSAATLPSLPPATSLAPAPYVVPLAHPGPAAATSTVLRAPVGPSGVRLLQRPVVAPPVAASVVHASAPALAVRPVAPPAAPPAVAAASNSASDAYAEFMKDIGGLLS